MLKQYPLKNYNDIYQRYIDVLATVEQRKSQLISLQFEYQKELEILQKYEKLRSNIHFVLDFLEKSKEVIPQEISTIPSINLGTLNGHALAVSKYVLKYPEERVLIVTINPKEFTFLSDVNCSVTKVHRNFSNSIRGQNYQRIILDNLSSDKIEEVLNCIPIEWLSNVVIVGGCYGTTDD